MRPNRVLEDYKGRTLTSHEHCRRNNGTWSVYHKDGKLAQCWGRDGLQEGGQSKLGNLRQVVMSGWRSDERGPTALRTNCTRILDITPT